ncbi:hypothetical protein BH11BAC5_BH11BAC5_21080 [soil metagenome]
MPTPYPKYVYCFLLSAFFFLQPVCAQLSFRGKVIDENGDAAIPHATVYFNNTTIATETNAKGEFSFDNIRFFNTEVVIVSPGYELFAFRPAEAKMGANKFVFKMRAKKAGVVPTAGVEAANTASYREAFRQGLLGITNEAAQSTVNNITDVYFENDTTSGGFNAAADTTLTIVNKLCGYKMYYNLVAFYYDAFTRQSYCSGYCRYEVLGDVKQFQTARNHCYFGSSQHFFRSLVANKLYEEGFGIFVKDTIPAAGGSNPGDEDRYRPITATQVLWIDSTNNYSIGIKDKLIIQYNSNPTTKSYLRTILEYIDGDLKKGIEASVAIKHAPVELTTIGVPVADSEMEYGGFWSYEKLANALPLDYQPDLKPLK